MATKTKKAFKGQKRPAGKALSSFEDMGKFFGMPAQKFRVVEMTKPFPKGADHSMKSMSPAEVLEHCQDVFRCGQLMHMKFKVDPDATSFKNVKKENKKG